MVVPVPNGLDGLEMGVSYLLTGMILQEGEYSYGYEFLLGIKRATPGPSCLIPIKRDPLFNRY